LSLLLPLCMLLLLLLPPPVHHCYNTHTQVQSDIRSISSKVYACEHSLRFPRVTRVR
jgi:hypothetical protein